MKYSCLLTDAVREVRHSLGRFLSLFLLSALSVAFLAGLRTAAPDMERSADAYYDAHDLMDVHMLSTLGLTEADIAALAAQEGIAHAEGAYSVDAIVKAGGNDRIVKVLSLSTLVNRPRLVTGRLPEAPDECLVEPSFLDSLGLSLGSTLSLNTGTDTFENALRRDTFTIVGTADSPLYTSVERGSSTLGTGRVSAFLLLPQEAFDMEAYTDAYLLADGTAALYCYDSGYQNHMDALLNQLKPLGEARAALRYSDIVGEAQTKLDDVQLEFNDAEAEANQKLADALSKLQDARRKLDKGWRDYNQGRVDLDRETADAQQKIDDAETIDLPQALADLQQGELDYADGLTEWEDGMAKYEDSHSAYEAAVQTYNDSYYEVVSKEVDFNTALQKLRDGEADYAAGTVAYAQGLDQLQEAGVQITEGERILQKALDRLYEGQKQYNAGVAQLQDSQAQFHQGETSFYAQVDGAKQLLGTDAGVDNDTFLNGLATMTPQEMGSAWTQIEQQRNQLSDALQNPSLPDGTRQEYEDKLAQMPDSQAALEGTMGAMLTGRSSLEGFRQQIYQGKATLDSAAGSLAWGQMEYYDGRALLTANKQQFKDAAAEAIPAGRDLTAARNELDDGWQAFRSGERTLENGWKKLEDAKGELTDAEVQLADALLTLLDGQSQLEDSRKKLDDGWTDYKQGLLDLADAKVTLETEIAQALQTLANAKRDLESGEADYAQGLLDYEDGKHEAEEALSDARQKLNDARRKIHDIEHCKWYVLGRNTNVGYVSFQQDAQRMGNLASLFPVIFFLVAALVCLTTITRMVEEHRVQIGGLKALGYGKGAISVKYVGYGLSASLFGGLFGLALGCTLIPWVIYSAWAIIYTLGPLVIPFYWDISLLSVGAAVFTVVGAALLTCWSTLSAVPAELMRPKTPKSGKRVLLERIAPLWRHISFNHKVTLRNLFRYKRRFLMTVIGIGGCTALIVTGFGLRDSILTIMDQQYDQLFTYTSQVGLVDDVTPDELAELRHALDNRGEITSSLLVHQATLSIEGDRRSMDGTLMVTDDPEAFGGFVALRHRLEHAPVSLPANGVVLTEKLADLLGAGVGDTVTLAGDHRVQVRVADITENYIGHYVYLSAAHYEQVYGVPPAGNLVLATYTEDTPAVCDAVAARLISLSGVTSVARISDTRNTYQHSMESVDYAVVVIIIAAAALAFVVLFNLTNINITERMRELATLKVLGFYDRELDAYVYRENVLLTLLGVLAGLVMGKFLHQWLVLTVEIDMLMFWRTAKPTSYLWAALLTILFSLLVNVAASRKLQKIDMVESLKTVE